MTHHSLEKVLYEKRGWKAHCGCGLWEMPVPTITTSALGFNLDLVYQAGVQVGVAWAYHVQEAIASEQREP